ncbi:hypothetical protein [Ornithinimicrobium cerasi]|uniref:DUF2157 domain-containing protein n=1 Tax=Ornithinimicrobium cerasi TaxID=2248773 RepID=A0A285VRR0_9MICO|nr:hypothetical protein [Ornithinimicrobium cerasi]SOC56278.1 hypothetical protein SAMN05421879_10756 [Ornithinimicrobium cerasi]
MTVAGWQRVLLGFSLALAAGEGADGFRLELPWMAWFYAALLLVGSVWLWRKNSRGAVAMLGALHLIELVMLLTVFRTAEEAPPTWLWWLFVLLSMAGSVAAGASLVSGRRRASAR